MKPLFPTGLCVGLATGVIASVAMLAQPAPAQTMVYVSNAKGAQIEMFEMAEDGTLAHAGAVAAGDVVMPMAVNPDGARLYAHARAEPMQLLSYDIDPGTGNLTESGRIPVSFSAPYIALDATGRHLFSVSYGANKLTVHEVTGQGPVSDAPPQILETGDKPHAVVVDPRNRYVFASNLGDDQVLQYVFDAATGSLTPNDPPAVATTTPRHLRFSPDGRILYVLSETEGTVTRFGLDEATGLLRELDRVAGVPAELNLAAGKPHGARTTSGQAAAVEDTTPVIWAADLQVSPDGRFVFLSERTSSTLSSLAVDPEDGHLTLVGNVATEAQPRGFGIDPSGRFLVSPGEKSDRLSVFRIDPAQGTLDLAGRVESPVSGNWVQFLELTPDR